MSVKTFKSTACCSIKLGVTMSGEKLPLFIIYRSELGGRISYEWTGKMDNLSSSFYCVQEKAWMDKRVLLEWLGKMWKFFCWKKSSLYLLLDKISVYLMMDCVNTLQDCGTEVDFFLAGYTTKL